MLPCCRQRRRDHLWRNKQPWNAGLATTGKFTRPARAPTSLGHRRRVNLRTLKGPSVASHQRWWPSYLRTVMPTAALSACIKFQASCHRILKFSPRHCWFTLAYFSWKCPKTEMITAEHTYGFTISNMFESITVWRFFPKINCSIDNR